MQSPISVILLSIANILVPLAILVFATGFFPYKPFLPGIAQYDDSSNLSASAPFNKVVFMVVDALRSDFVYSNESGFAFTQSLIKSGAAIPFTAHATSPTITMPRVKAITTGSIPSFLDVILNFAESDTSSTLANQDTWLAQLKAKEGGKLVMYGDDTWIKLFPDSFSRVDGTSSFFVSDFTEVDNNVTRHIPSELRQDDWNGMILHYLGLDHLGHKSGPRSPHMAPKQIEMDSVVQQVYHAIESEAHLRSTLFVLCGDHGMNDAGNHGGSGAGETSPALVFMSPKIQSIFNGTAVPAGSPTLDFQYYSVVEQSDIVPTIAGLLGSPIPLNNLGIFIPEFLQFWRNGDEKVQLMLENAKQVLKIIKENFIHIDFDNDLREANEEDCSSDAQRLHWLWKMATTRLSDRAEGPEEALEALTTFLKSAQSVMSSTASNYNLQRLQVGIGIAGLSGLIVLVILQVARWQSGVKVIWVSVLAVLYGTMMFASSYVEEEQHFWYWMASAWVTLLYLKGTFTKNQPKTVQTLSLLALMILRLLRRWNQTGQKHLGDPDIARTFFSSHNWVMWVLVASSYIDIAQRLARRGLPRVPRQVVTPLTFALCLVAFEFKTIFTKADAPELLDGLQSLPIWPMLEASLVTRAKAIFLSIAAAVVFTLFSEFVVEPTSEDRTEAKGATRSLHDLLVLFLMTQSRVNNIPLFLLFEIELNVLGSLDLSADDITLATILFQHASFFAMGGSNAISSIDLSNAYNGVSGYNVVAVGVLTFLSNWAGPVWWTSASTLLLLQANPQGKPDILLRHLSIHTFFTATSVLFVMLACTALRTHLFIWTVFSPKYLYSMAWSLGQHLCINVGFGSLLFWYGSSRVRQS